MIKDYVAIDTETTGVNPASDRIIEIGMAKIHDGCIVDTFSTLVDPGMSLLPRIIEITGITDDMLKGKPCIGDIIKDVIMFSEGLPILGHNLIFDYSFIKKAAVNNGFKFEREGIDTLKISRKLLKDIPHKNLSYLCEYFDIDPGNSHRAYDDAVSAAKLYEQLAGISPEDVDINNAKELVYQVKKDSPVTDAQKRYLIALLEKHSLVPDYDVDRLTKSRASKLIDGILSEYGK